MAVDAGSSGNTSRYYSVPDSAGLSLPNKDWTWLVLIRPTQTPTEVTYIISKGAYFEDQSFNLYLYPGTGLVCQVSMLGSVLSGSTLPNDKWYWAYATRRSSVLKVGYCEVGTSASFETGSESIVSEYNSTSALNIGRRSDGDIGRYWQGRYSDTLFINGYSLKQSDARALALGNRIEDMSFYDHVVFHAEFSSANKSYLVDKTGRYALTRNGTGWGVNQKDPLSRQSKVSLLSPSLFSVGGGSIIFGATPSASLAASGALSTQINFAASPSAALVANAALNSGINLSAVASGSLNASGVLNTSIRFAAASTASLSALGGLSTQIVLDSAFSASLISSGALSTGISFASSAAIGLSASADLLTISSGLSANSFASFLASGALSTSINLATVANFGVSASANLLAGSGGGLEAGLSASLTASGALSAQIVFSASPSASVSASASLQLLANSLASSASMGVVSSALLLTGIRLQALPSFTVSAIAGWGFVSAPSGNGSNGSRRKEMSSRQGNIQTKARHNGYVNSRV